MNSVLTYRSFLLAWHNRKLPGCIQIVVMFLMLTGGTAKAAMFEEIINFSSPHAPRSPLVQAADGNFYGTTSGGGRYGYGTVFRMTPAGVLTTLVTFNKTNGDAPIGGLVRASDGNFYGTTSAGGAEDSGTVFRMTTNGVLSTLVSFNGTNGDRPYGELLQASDGDLYGTTYSGGKDILGTVFRMSTNGVLTTLVSFNSTNGANPVAGLVEGGDGNLYGTTQYGGARDAGTVFRVTTNGVLTTLGSGGNNFGVYPMAGLIRGSDGNFYGATSSDGEVFRMTPEGEFFYYTSFDLYPGMIMSGLVQGRDGFLYGVTIDGGTNYLGTVFQITNDWSMFTIAEFDSTIGSTPSASLVQGVDGDLYGITFDGEGTIFKVTTNGSLTRLAMFDNNPAGYIPQNGLLFADDGNLYGVTGTGGANNFGTVYEVATNGALTVLASFDYFHNASAPHAPLIKATDGNLYGTTGSGGTNGDGTVFKVSTGGELSVLVWFNGTNGSYPAGSLVQGSNGELYGTTARGGANDLGTIFKMTTNGILTSLVSFDGSNGSVPFLGGLARGKDGNFYGTTISGGAYDSGTVFRMSPSGELTTIFQFDGTNGILPLSLIVGESDASLYGTCSSGIFKITSNGVFTSLFSFNTSKDFPVSGLVQGLDGDFYGTTSGINSDDPWTVFKITANGKFTTLLSISGGLRLGWGVVQATDGSFYGIYSESGDDRGECIYRLFPPPEIRAEPKASGGLTLSWNSVIGHTYQLQYQTDLNQAEWNNLGNAITASNLTTTVSDEFGLGAQKFYRVVQLP